VNVTPGDEDRALADLRDAGVMLIHSSDIALVPAEGTPRVPAQSRS
jgi:hypothetical protein